MKLGLAAMRVDQASGACGDHALSIASQGEVQCVMSKAEGRPRSARSTAS